jgi:hypothetical protein
VGPNPGTDFKTLAIVLETGKGEYPALMRLFRGCVAAVVALIKRGAPGIAARMDRFPSTAAAPTRRQDNTASARWKR